jgi:MFS family permease
MWMTSFPNDNSKAKRYMGSQNPTIIMCGRVSSVFDGVWGSGEYATTVRIIPSLSSIQSTSLTQHHSIIFRAFQGIGGSGLYSLTFVCIMKLIEPEKIGFYSGVISSVFAMANLLGPLFGGVISDRTTWRWIFFIK